jgi:glycosyltransferase involved in cell wall biosynthesis
MKVLFVIQAFRQGGANRSLQYLLQALEGTSIDLSLFVLSHQGPYRKVFERYHVLPEDFMTSTLLTDLSLEPVSIRRWVRWVLRTIFRIFRVVGLSTHDLFFRNARRYIEQQHPDVVIAFQEGTVSDFVAPLRVSRKLGWIHSDYSGYLCLAGRKPERKLYQQFHGVVCVSEFTAGRFRNILPDQNGKVHVIHNVMAQESIRQQATEKIIHPLFVKKGTILISVGRLDPVKRFTQIPVIAAQLKAAGFPFRWFVVGGGSEYSLIQSAINHHAVHNEVIMLGEINSPYAMMAASDVVVSLSESEACPMGVQEAKILGVPVLSTDYGSATEFVIAGEGGCVVPLNEIARTLTDWLKDPEALTALKRELSDYQFDEQSIVGQLLALLKNKS